MKFYSLTCKFVYLETVDSTNAYAQSYASKCDPNEFTVIYTYNQSLGKGQIGRKWYSGSDENLSFSIIYFPEHLEATESFRLLQHVSLAITEALFELTQIRFNIKWPNDIYYNDKKLAGVLIQNTVREKKIQSCVIGIGININSDSFPKELINPISLKQITARNYQLDAIMHQLGQSICKGIQRPFIDNNKSYLKQLYRLNEWYQYKDKVGEIFDGKIIGVDRIGRLQIEDNSSEIRHFDIREIEFIL